jgi:uncharacterized RDD family membrane protein YckC
VYCTSCGIAIKKIPLPASAGKRLGNYLLDGIFIQLINFVLGFVAGLTFGENISELALFGFSVLIFLAYYIISEAVWGKTLAKLITKTKVVDKDGNLPSWGKTIGRTFARFIPFETLSFLTRKFPAGWHDKLSKTYVVADAMTTEDIKQIDVTKGPKMSSVWLILVGIFLGLMVIMFVLSSIMTIALGDARSKSRDAFRVSQVKQIQVALEIYYEQNSEYPESLKDLSGIIDSIEAPEPNENPECENRNDYKYSTTAEQQLYEIEFCLEEGAGIYFSGVNTVTEGL